MGLFSKKATARIKGNLTAQSQLASNGVDFNMPTFIELDKGRYRRILQDQDFIETTNRYTWKFPKEFSYLHGELIETMLYNRAGLSGAFFGGELLILPYANNGKINKYSIPERVDLISYNGDTTTKIITGIEVYGYGNSTNSNSKKAVLLFDRTPRFQNAKPIPRALLSQMIIEDMAEILARVKNNIKNSDKKIVFYCANEKQKAVFYQAIKNSFNSDDNFIVMVKNDLEETAGVKSEPFHTDVELQAQALFEAYQSLNNIRCQIVGINVGGAFEKKERKLVDEVSGNENQTNLSLQNGLNMRKLFIDQLTLAYPQYSSLIKQIKVEITSNNDNKENNDYANNNDFSDRF